MITKQKRFLLVDDDPQNNLLSKMALKKSFGDVDVKDFVLPEKGLEYIQSESALSGPQDVKTTLFLDIDMPTLTGWDFLKKFEALKESIKAQFDIYVLSSSVDPRDIERAKSNPLVRDFIEKPLNKATLIKMFGGIIKLTHIEPI
jgi:response regulator RpfG family c-di-GMP phosphodiesterase